jgi:hypothetical protein
MARKPALLAGAAVAVLVGGVLWLARAPRASPPATATPGDAAPPLAGKAFYRVDAGAAPPCDAGTTCEARLVLTALGAYHVNEAYPFKFVADPASAVLAGPATFARDDATRGTLTIKFRPDAAGTAQLAGTFKLSVCSEDTCEIEAPRIAFAVPVR